MKPINLPLAKVVKAARKAYDEGRLSAQGPTPACRYRDRSGRPCAIGAALTDKRARECDGYGASDIPSLVRSGALVTDDVDALDNLQIAHDYWANGAANGATRFLQVLTELEAR